MTQEIITYEYIPEYKMEYKGDRPLWVLSGQIAKIDKYGRWFDVHINTEYIPFINKAKPIFVDKSTAISVEGECTLINSKRTEWQKQLVHNDYLTKGEKCVLLLFLDLYCQEIGRDLVLYTEPIKFMGTNNILNNPKLKDDREFIYS